MEICTFLNFNLTHKFRAKNWQRNLACQKNAKIGINFGVIKIGTLKNAKFYANFGTFWQKI